MSAQPTTRVRGTAGLALTMTLATVALGWAAGRALSAETGDPATAVVTAAAMAAAACSAWLALSALLHLAARLPGRVGSALGRLAVAVTPTLMRQLLTITVSTASAAATLPGASVAAAAGVGSEQEAPRGGSVPEPGFAAPSAPTPSPSARAAGSSSPPSPSWSPAPETRTTHAVPSAPSPGWTPAAPRPVRQPALEVIGGRAGYAHEEGYVVRRGDCLWDVVGRHLGARATPATIAAAIPAWHRANRAVIGADPDLIQPGITLVAPGEHP